MVYGHRPRYRRFRRRFKRRWSTTRRRRYRRRFIRRRRGTTSSVVKLTYDTTWTLNISGTGSAATRWNAFSFSPLSLPGFSDYQTTYSHFRILKAKLFVSRSIGSTDGALYNYLVVGSRPFAATAGPLENLTTAAEAYVPPQLENDLRQTKWQRVHYPSTTTQRVTAGFYPYTLVGTFGPAGVGNSAAYQRIWEGRKWMPFNWAFDETNSPRGIMFYGPYMVVDTATGELPVQRPAVQCTLQVHVQFKGQR